MARLKFLRAMWMIDHLPMDCMDAVEEDALEVVDVLEMVLA